MTPRVAPVPAVLLAATLLAACGGSSSDPGRADRGEAVEIVLAAADETAAAETARMSLRITTEGGPTDFEVTMAGTIDLEHEAARFTMDTGELLGGSFEMLMVDGVAYMNVSALGEDVAVPDGIEWLAMDLEQVSGGATAATSDPTSFTGMFEALRGASRDVDELGHEEVDGADTTHYRVELDLGKALEEVPEDRRVAAQRALEMFGDGTLPAEVWIDDSGRLRRMELRIDGEDLGDASVAGLTMLMVVELSDFGVEVEVEAPPADKTTSLLSDSW